MIAVQKEDISYVDNVWLIGKKNVKAVEEMLIVPNVKDGGAQ